MADKPVVFEHPSSLCSLKEDLTHAGCIVTRCLLLANLIVCIFCLHTDVMNEGAGSLSS